MKKYPRAIYSAISIMFIASLAFILMPAMASAATVGELTERSLSLVGVPNSTTPADSTGGSEAGAVVNNVFTFTTATADAIGSIGFQYCTTPQVPALSTTCTTPTGLVTTSATLSSVSGDSSTFAIDTTTNGSPYIYASGTAASVSAGTQIVVQLDSITNPTTANQSFYVRISTYTTTTASGTVIDAGNVAASTANQIDLLGDMPESLVFCVGATVGESGGVPNCSTATAGTVDFSTLFTPTAASTATSQMAASTNANHGYVITVNGSTLQSGSSSIAPMSTAGTSVNGTSQFGLNLVANTTATSTPAVGQAITPASDPSSTPQDYDGQALTNYNKPDTFAYVSGANIANSGDNSAAAPAGTDLQIYTVSYIVNVPGNQPAGTYTTTLTYICTPTF